MEIVAPGQALNQRKRDTTIQNDAEGVLAQPMMLLKKMLDHSLDASIILVTVSTSTFQANSIRSAIMAICAVSAGAVAFLLWLVYARHAPVEFANRLTFLPAFNALFNGLSANAILLGLIFIYRGWVTAHRNAMLFAFCFSSLFLVSYITNHALHGETRYPAGVGYRSVYLAILSSHILLSIVALPLVLITFLLSLTGRFAMQKRLARFTFPIWLYVSVTGVVVFLMLHAALRNAGG
jgi:putative membrane protein